MDLLKDLRASLLNFSFGMIYIIHKMLVLFKNHLNFLNAIFECFFKEFHRLLNFYKKTFFSHNI